MISKTTFLKRLRHNPLSKKPRQQGIALILAITSLMFMVYIASEVTKDSATEYIVNSQELTRLKAYYAARNSMQIALLRIKIFQQATKVQLPEAFASQIDLLWKFPFAWPLPIPAELNSVDGDMMKKVSAESLMDATYTHTIEDEGSKIDLNDLASPSKTLREITKKMLLNVFEQENTNNEEFRGTYQSFNFNELVDKIQDWMSDSTTSGSGSGDKRAAFSSLGDGYPPNRGFRTIEELRLVPGMTDEFFALLAPRITIYGMKAINPNTATKEVLMALDPGMNAQSVDDAIAKRNDPQQGPFKGESSADCRKNFKDFVSQHGARLAPEFDNIPMVCGKVFNFRIIATGIYGAGKSALQKNIVAVVVDLNRSAAQIKQSVEADRVAAGGAAAAGSTSGAQKQDPLPKGPPRIVYWTEY